MLSFTDILIGSAFLAVAHGHAAILGAQGDAGSPASVGFLVDPNIARNCTTINPCQQDATIIRDKEINSNIVNECGRTEIAGNIDIGESTENALAANQVTQVKAGGEVTVTIHQVNADGAGPFSCDLDQTSNSLGGTGQIPLEVTNNVPGANGFSQAKAQQFNVTVKMPADMKCNGASTGNVCTVRCRNNAVAGPFGGCFAVQQTDVTPTQNTPQNIQTGAKLKGVLQQVQQDIVDFPAAAAANQKDGTPEQLAATDAANKVLGAPPVTVKEFPVENTGPSQTGGNTAAAPAAAPAAPAADPNAGNANAGNGNANAGDNGNAGNAGNAGGNGRARGKGRAGKRGRAAKREENGSLRWAKRYVVPGADFQPEVMP
ncbi:hypothetical protein BDP81DRAFT_324910 [Colletotrichum phormii]|uniref:Gas1-like protein n=1 Tax=Colletotrichum phormii TaxID=359342 RepID=A0AAI9ZM86_9PEZI|nr:uncharacterized protein BDP81DRAFT_324910 [Colletotrichum phormii]KAK1634251.1 hypothetical protein BDP81DRAFT_324910 [Colletotrichum phormii]